MTADWVTTRREGVVQFVELNRPEKRNAITPDMLVAIAEAIASASSDPQLRAVVVCGAGPVFSAGIDIMSLAAARGEAEGVNPGRALRLLAERLQEALFRIESTELPIIGALHGQVLGLGLELALSFDLRVGAEDIKIGLPETRMGLVADVGGTTRLARLVGPSRAKDMLMTARTVAAEEALRWGLLDRVAPAGDVLRVATELAHQIAANAPLAVGLSKFIIDQGAGLDRHTQMAIERLAQSQIIDSQDVMEAVAAFFEKRPPNFQGK